MSFALSSMARLCEPGALEAIWRDGLSAVANVVNPFDYLTALLRHAEAVAAAPATWMHRNYGANFNDLASG